MTTKQATQELTNTLGDTFEALLAENIDAIREAQDDDGKSVVGLKVEIEWTHPPKGRCVFEYKSRRERTFHCEDPNQGKLGV